MEKTFGNKSLGFSIKCKKIRGDSGGIFAKLALTIHDFEIGSFDNICHAGAIIHSAQVFLSNKGKRNYPTPSASDVFDSLFHNLYGENWQNGLQNKLGPRFAVHEVFDVSVGDEGWVVFLVDGANNATLTFGSRDDGFISSVQTPIGFVEDSIQNLINWLSHPG